MPDYSIGNPACTPRLSSGVNCGAKAGIATSAKCFRCPATLTVHHPHRSHMAVKRQFAGALMKYLAIDIRRLLGSEKHAKRCYGIGPAAPQPLLAQRRRRGILSVSAPNGSCGYRQKEQSH